MKLESSFHNRFTQVVVDLTDVDHWNWSSSSFQKQASGRNGRAGFSPLRCANDPRAADAKPCAALKRNKFRAPGCKRLVARMLAGLCGAVDRLLDAFNPSATLTSSGKSARALARKVRIERVPA